MHRYKVEVRERPESLDWERRHLPAARAVVFSFALAMLPVAIFGLMLYVTRHQ